MGAPLFDRLYKDALASLAFEQHVYRVAIGIVQDGIEYLDKVCPDPDDANTTIAKLKRIMRGLAVKHKCE